MNLSNCALALGENWQGTVTIAYYSHLLPAALAIFLGIYAALKAGWSKSAAAFLGFALAVALWLLNDVILWTTQSYYSIAFFWSWIDFANVVFFIFAAYFFGVLARGSITSGEKIFLLVLAVPSLIVTVMGRSVTGFDHTWCEMFNNDTAVLIKSSVEWVCILFMAASYYIARKGATKNRRTALTVVLAAMVLFLATFSVTEYLSAQTAHYEINLYGLFILPLFLIVMVFAITNLEVFKIRYLGTQIIVYVLVLFIASQLLFLQSSTDATLTLITLGLAISICAVLIRNERREMESLIEIENLAEQLSDANANLRKLDRLKSQFLSFASHQLKAPMNSIRWTASLIADGSLGEIPEKVQQSASNMGNTAAQLTRLVDEFLNLRKLEEGKMEYAMEPVDLGAVVREIVKLLEPSAEHKSLVLSLAATAKSTWVLADKQLVTQVVMNLVDNAIKYTDKGSVTVTVANEDPKSITVSVADTGHGMEGALLTDVFVEFVRDSKGAARIEGTGLGLYIAKQIVEAHHGKIWAESPGRGKGSTFRVLLPTTDQHP